VVKTVQSGSREREDNERSARPKSHRSDENVEKMQSSAFD